MPQLNQKGVAHIFIILIILLAGVVGGLYLIKNPQILKSRAVSGPIGGDLSSLNTLFTVYSNYSSDNVEVDPLALRDGDEVTVKFNPVGGSEQGYRALHTAIWQGANNEKEAKKDNREGDYIGFDLRNNAADAKELKRTAKVPFYMEFYTEDINSNQEPTHKVVIKQTPKQAIVFSLFPGDPTFIQFKSLSEDSSSVQVLRDKSKEISQNKAISIASSLIGVPTLLVDGQKNTYSPVAPSVYEFSYLTAGSHTLYFTKPDDYTIAFVICSKHSSSKCFKQYPKLYDQRQVPGKLYAIDFNLKEEDDYQSIGMYYYPVYSGETITLPSPLPPPPPPTYIPIPPPVEKPTIPTNLSVACGSNDISLNWNGVSSASAYAIRLDGPATSKLNNCGPHNICINDYKGGESVIVTKTGSGKFSFWVHAVLGNILGESSGIKEFTCNY